MTLTRLRDQYLMGATKWAVMRDDIPDFAGVSEETGSVFAVDRTYPEPTLVRVGLEEASAVAAGSEGMAWVATRDGWLVQYSVPDLAVQDSAQLATDGAAVAATDADIVYVTRSGGRLTKIDSFAVVFEIYLPHPALGLLVGEGCIYALLDNAVLAVVTEDTIAQTFRIEYTLALPATFGLRDIVQNGPTLFLVGTDRLGNGSVVEVDITEPLVPELVDVDRVQSPFIVLTTDGSGRIGTVLPQTPYTMPEVPWQGRTDCIRMDIADETNVLIARPAYAEVWVGAAELVASWTSRTPPSTSSWLGLAWGEGAAYPAPGTWVGISNGTGWMTSIDDDATFQAATAPAAADWAGICHCDDLEEFVAVSRGGSGDVGRSVDGGLNWLLEAASEVGNWASVVRGNGVTVAVSYDTAASQVMTSPDNQTWTSKIAAAVSGWISVAYQSSLVEFFAVSFDGDVMRSADNGDTWAIEAAPSGAWSCITYSADLDMLVAVGSDGQVMTKTADGPWTLRAAASVGAWSAVVAGVAGPRTFVAVAAGSTPGVMSSADGITWVSETQASTDNWTRLATNGTTFGAVANAGAGSRVMFSP